VIGAVAQFDAANLAHFIFAVHHLRDGIRKAAAAQVGMVRMPRTVPDTDARPRPRAVKILRNILSVDYKNATSCLFSLPNAVNGRYLASISCTRMARISRLLPDADSTNVHRRSRSHAVTDQRRLCDIIESDHSSSRCQVTRKPPLPALCIEAPTASRFLRCQKVGGGGPSGVDNPLRRARYCAVSFEAFNF
jgi:hypothetical protein